MPNENLEKFISRYGLKNYPLHEAVISGELKRVKSKLKEGFDQSHTLPDGDTALHVAAICGLPEIVSCLIQNSSDVNSVERERFSPLHFAVTSNFRFREYCPVEPDTSSRLECCRLLIAAGANLDIRGGIGQTPLHLAVQSQDLPVIELLLDHGASVTVRDRDGCTPLHYACNCAKPDVFEVLLRFGANPQAKTKDGKRVIELLDLDEDSFATEEARIKSLLLASSDYSP